MTLKQQSVAPGSQGSAQRAQAACCARRQMSWWEQRVCCMPPPQCSLRQQSRQLLPLLPTTEREQDLGQQWG